MFKRYKSVIVVVLFLLLIIVISGLNLYLLLENMNTRDERIHKSVQQVIESIPKKSIINQPVEAPHTPVKGVDYFDGKDGVDGADGKSVKGDTGEPGRDGIDGKDGHNAPFVEIRCNTKKNRWEAKYVGDLTWQIMNNEVVKCTIEEETNDGNE